MKRIALAVVWTPALLAAVFGSLLGQARDLYPNAPDELIVRKAAQQAPPLWQIPLGPAMVEDMQWLGSERLLVGLRKDFPGLPNLDYLLVDTARGEVVWRCPREKVKGRYDRLLVLQDLLLFRVDRGRTVSLLALDPATGAEKWTAAFRGEQVKFVPFMAGGAALAVTPGRSAVEIAAVDLGGGEVLWRKSFRTASGAALPAPQTLDRDLLVFYGGLERLSCRNGETVFSRPDLTLDENSPPPQVADGALWVVHSGNRLNAVDLESGSDKWTAPLRGDVRVLNIYPLGTRLYLRGVDDSGLHHLQSLYRADGRTAWAHSGTEPSISNMIESGGVLYFGTPTSLVALNAVNGRKAFSALVTTTGRTFPVRVRKAGGRIIYIGELVVAAFDAKTGNLVYKQGMTPGSGELHLNGLDDAAPNLKAELAGGAKNPAGNYLSSKASFATGEAARYQNLARTYEYQAEDFRQQGDMLKSSIAGMRSDFAKHEARLQSMSALVYSSVDLAIMIRQLISLRSIQTAIDRQEMFRKSILASYAQAETAEYVFRPHLAFKDVQDSFSTVSIVHLSSGKRADTVLAPHYLSYGLWQVVDFQKGVVFHCHVGMDPSRYELSQPRAYYPYKKARTVNTFLIAQPVRIPR